MENRGSLSRYSLYSSRRINMDYCRYPGRVGCAKWKHTQHKWTDTRVGIDVEPFINILLQNHWRKRPEYLTEFHFPIQDVLHVRVSWITKDASLAEGPRT